MTEFKKGFLDFWGVHIDGFHYIYIYVSFCFLCYTCTCIMMYVHVSFVIHVCVCTVHVSICFPCCIYRWMINYVNDPDEASWRGYFYACLLFIAAVIQSLLLHQYFHRCFIVGMRVRSAVVAAVYEKVGCRRNLNHSIIIIN